VAGASSGQIMVYDVESRQRILNVYGHDDDGEFVGRTVIEAELTRERQSTACVLPMRVPRMCWFPRLMMVTLKSGTYCRCCGLLTRAYPV
jgi:hypothetical protein